MTIVIKEVNEKKEWNEFVQTCAPYAVFQSWQWGEVTKKQGRPVWRLGWFEKDRLVAVSQIEKVNARRGTFLHIRHGPILRHQSKSLWGAIQRELTHLARRERAWFVRVSPQLEDSIEQHQFFRHLSFVAAPIHAMDAEHCWVLDLDKSPEELLTGMRKTTRYEIRRAKSMGVQIEKVTGDGSFRDFNRLYVLTSRRHNFVGHIGIQEEVKVFSETNDIVTILGRYNNEIVAAAIILFWGDEAIYHHGASIPSKAPASYAVQWEAILEAIHRGKKVYNFWGIAPEDNVNHPWRGITLFKKGFGGREIKYIHAQDYPVSPLYIIPKTIEKIRKRMKGY